MAKYCAKCGKELSEAAKFCAGCGAEIANTKTTERQSMAQVQPMKQEEASATAGEFRTAEFEMNLPLTPTFVGVITSGIKNVFFSIKNIGKSPKAIFIVAMLAVSWIVTTIFSMLPIHSRYVEILSFLTFAQPGVKGGIVQMIGCIVGRGMFAGALCSLVCSIGRKKQGGKPFADKVKAMISFPLHTLGLEILGAGISFLLLVFMSGYVSKFSFMGGLAAAYLSFKATWRNGFIKKLFTSFARGKRQNSMGYEGIMKGCILGFTLSAIISLQNSNLAVIMIGLVLLFAGMVFILLKVLGVFPKIRKGGASV